MEILLLSLINLLILLCLLQCVKLGPVVVAVAAHSEDVGVQTLSKIAIHRAVYALHENASIKASPIVLGAKVIIFFIIQQQ